MSAGPWRRAVLLTAAVALAILGLFLSIYLLRPVEGGIGWDTVEYTWRTKLAMAEGIERVPPDLPFPAKQGRPAYPALAGVLTSLFGAGGPGFVAVALPPVLAAAIGLAAGALCAVGLGLGRWATAFIAVFVGASTNVVLMMRYAYLDNMMLAAVFLAVIAYLVAGARAGRGAASAVLLLASLALLHGAFFPVAVVVLLVAAVALLPFSLAARRAGTRSPLRTPTGIVGLTAAGGTALGAGALALLGARPDPALVEEEFIGKLREDLGWYALPATVPLAATGAVVTARGTPDDGRHTLIALLLSWVGVTAAAFLAWAATDLAVPVNRFLVFALPLPILAALGVHRLLRRLALRRIRVAIAVGIATLGAVGALAGYQWMRTDVFMDVDKLRAGAVAAEYLDAADVGPGRPLVFLIDVDAPNVALTAGLDRDHLLASLPAERFPDVHVFLGTPEDYLARRPTERPGRLDYGRVSRALLRRLELRHRDPLALLLEPFHADRFRAWTAEHRRAQVAPGVAIVDEMPDPAAHAAAGAPPDPLGLPLPLAVTVVPLAILLLVWASGLGWSLAAGGHRPTPVTVLGLAPAVGIAAIVVAAVALDRVGLPSSLAWIAVPLAAGAGWTAAARARRGGHRL